MKAVEFVVKLLSGQFLKQKKRTLCLHGFEQFATRHHYVRGVRVVCVFFVNVYCCLVDFIVFVGRIRGPFMFQKFMFIQGQGLFSNFEA